MIGTNPRPAVSMAPLCNELRACQGLVTPRNCVVCNLGPCLERPQATKSAPLVLDVSGLEFSEAEINCEGGNCG